MTLSYQKNVAKNNRQDSRQKKKKIPSKLKEIQTSKANPHWAQLV